MTFTVGGTITIASILIIANTEVLITPGLRLQEILIPDFILTNLTTLGWVLALDIVLAVLVGELLVRLLQRKS
jgi:hypothetical protein